VPDVTQPRAPRSPGPAAARDPQARPADPQGCDSAGSGRDVRAGGRDAGPWPGRRPAGTPAGRASLIHRPHARPGSVIAAITTGSASGGRAPGGAVPAAHAAKSTGLVKVRPQADAARRRLPQASSGRQTRCASQSAHCRSQLTSSDSRSAMWSRPLSSVSSPESGSSGAGQPSARSSPSAASSASRPASATSWCTRYGDSPPAAASLRIKSPRREPRPAPTSVPARPAPAATRPGIPAAAPAAPVGRPRSAR